MLEETDERKNGHIVYKCQCDCGNITYVIKSNLGKSTKSCGCLKKKVIAKNNMVDLSNKIFGKLTVISQTESKNGYTYWNCKCECGNFIIVKEILLSSGGVKSCGCLKSLGESKIVKYLQLNQIKFERQKTFDSCRIPSTNKKAKFDFYLPDLNILIEYDGIQHFIYKENGWNTKEHLEETQKRDKYKNMWAKENNIKLIRIKYTNLKNIDEILDSLFKNKIKEDKECMNLMQ